MTLSPVGEIIQINRYPVKSFAGESLESCRIEAYGLYGDRCYAFIDETKEGWDRYITARHIPAMLGYQAALTGEMEGQPLPNVQILSPDGRILRWDEQLLSEIQSYSNRKISMMTCNPNNEDLMAVDSAAILIVTDKSLRLLEERWGKQLDLRRFRANLLISVFEDSLGESHWMGKRLTLGGAELSIEHPCERCSMITMDPDTHDRDASLLKIVTEEWGLNFDARLISRHRLN